MSEGETGAAAAGWYSDPHGGPGMRYWDGSTWTEHATGGPSDASQPPGADTSTRTAVPPWALAAAGVGAAMLLLSFFVLNWYTPTAAEKAQVREQDADPTDVTFGVPIGNVLDGLTWSEIRTISDAADSAGAGDDVTGDLLARQYVQWGWIAALLAAAACVAALFVPRIRRYAVIAALVAAAWHAWVVNDFAGASSDTSIGAWLGAIGLVVVAVTVQLHRTRARVATGQPT